MKPRRKKKPSFVLYCSLHDAPMFLKMGFKRSQLSCYPLK